MRRRPFLLLSIPTVLAAVLLFSGTPGSSTAASSETEPAPILSNVSREKTVIGVLETLDPAVRTSLVLQTIDRITEALPDTAIDIQTLSAVNTRSDIERTKPDFLIAPSGVYLDLAQTFGLKHIATRKRAEARDPSRSVASVFVVRADRNDVRTLADLQGKTVGAGFPDSIDGWLAAQGEIQRQGYDPENFFREERFLLYPFPDIIRALMKGSIDAGIFPACLIEELEAKHALAPGLLRAVNEKSNDTLACRHSTALYPDWIVASFERASPEMVRDVTIALLTMPQTNGFEWWATIDLRGLNDLYKELRLGPWSFLRDFSPEGLIKRFRTELTIALFLLLAVLVNEWRLRLLVRRRTAELSSALKERDMNAELVRRLQAHLARTERLNAVAQLSSMIAHELKQPIGSVMNYAVALSARMADLLDGRPECREALKKIRTESKRISEIVDSVRRYAKSRNAPLTPCSLNGVVEKAVLVWRSGEGGRIVPTVSADPDVTVLGNELELELLVLNLIRNAAEAQQDVKSPEILIEIRALPTPSVSVSDRGPRLSDAEFQRLETSPVSVKEEGLGLGLELVRRIAAMSDASFRFERREGKGLTARVIFPAPKTESDSNKESPHDQSQHV